MTLDTFIIVLILFTRHPSSPPTFKFVCQCYIARRMKGRDCWEETWKGGCVTLRLLLWISLPLPSQHAPHALCLSLQGSEDWKKLLESQIPSSSSKWHACCGMMTLQEGFFSQLFWIKFKQAFAAKWDIYCTEHRKNFALARWTQMCVFLLYYLSFIKVFCCSDKEQENFPVSSYHFRVLCDIKNVKTLESLL